MAEDTNMRIAQFSNRRMLPAPGEALSSGWGQQMAENAAALGRHAFLTPELAWKIGRPIGGFYEPVVDNFPAGGGEDNPKTAMVFGGISGDSPPGVPGETGTSHTNWHILNDLGVSWTEGYYSDATGRWGEWVLPIPILNAYGKDHLTGVFSFKMIGSPRRSDYGGTGTGPFHVYPFVKSTIKGLDRDGEGISREEWGRKLISGTVYENGVYQAPWNAEDDLVTGQVISRNMGLNPIYSSTDLYGTAFVGFCYDFGYGTQVQSPIASIQILDIMVYSVGTTAPGETR